MIVEMSEKMGQLKIELYEIIVWLMMVQRMKHTYFGLNTGSRHEQ